MADDDSWENADLESRLKSLAPPSARPPPPSSRHASDAGEALIPAAASPAGATRGEMSAASGLDPALLAAATSANKQERLAVLRFEIEMEAFVMDSRSTSHIFGPPLTAYERMLAHKIAQMYGMATESDPAGRVIAIRTPASRLPPVRLADAAMAGEDGTPAGPAGVAFAIKRREDGGAAAREALAAWEAQPLKSTEDRMLDYERARQRIMAEGGEDPTAGPAGTAAGEGDDWLLEGPRGDPPGASPPPPAPATDDSLSEGTGAVGGSRGGAPGRGSGRAVFRDRAKDMADPDYDRSRFRRPIPTEGMYAPGGLFLPPPGGGYPNGYGIGAYAVDFPALGGGPPAGVGGYGLPPQPPFYPPAGSDYGRDYGDYGGPSGYGGMGAGAMPPPPGPQGPAGVGFGGFLGRGNGSFPGAYGSGQPQRPGSGRGRAYGAATRPS